MLYALAYHGEETVVKAAKCLSPAKRKVGTQVTGSSYLGHIGWKTGFLRQTQIILINCFFQELFKERFHFFQVSHRIKIN